MSARALLAVAEAASAVHLSEQDWLGGICGALRRARTRSQGAWACTFRLTEGRLEVLHGVGDSRAFDAAAHGRELVTAMTTAQREALLATPALATTATAAFGGQIPPSVATSWAASGIADALALVATLDDGHGIAVLAAEPQRLDGRVARQASLAVESLRTALKLRRALGDCPIEQAVRAAFDPETSQEAQGVKTSLVALRSRTPASESATPPRPAGPNSRPAAEGAWAALCQGRYRLVDHFSREGRRYVVLVAARRADPLRALTEVESEIAELCGSAWGNKQIAFELGLSESAVENHVARILCKLRLDSRLELVRLYTQLEATEDSAPRGAALAASPSGPRAEPVWQ